MKQESLKSKDYSQGTQQAVAIISGVEATWEFRSKQDHSGAVLLLKAFSSAECGFLVCRNKGNTADAPANYLAECVDRMIKVVE